MFVLYYDLFNKWIFLNVFKIDLRFFVYGIGLNIKCFFSLRGWVNLDRLRFIRVVFIGRVFSIEVIVVGVVRIFFK